MRFAILAALMASAALAQNKVELLWPEGAPQAQGDTDADKPTLAHYLPTPEKNTGTAVIVCPGGGYQNLAMDHEGRQIAEWLNQQGIAAFILKYRLGPRYRHPAMINDAHRAIRMVRSHAKELGVAPDRIGIWGFSAGGHLAATAATHFEEGENSNRPDFAILAYPVISFTTDYVHRGSRRNLIGDPPDPELQKNLSNELQVTPRTPPIFLFHTNEDTGVPPENSVLFYMALRKAKVPAEMHIFEPGRHGVGLAQQIPALAPWPMLLRNWFVTRGLIPKS